MICENCGIAHDGSYGSGRFCSIKCSRGFSTKAKRKEINESVSKTCKEKNIDLFKIIKCSACGKEMKVSKKSIKKKYCSKKCLHEHLHKQEYYKNAVKEKCTGGYRKGSGRGKHGWYKGIYCDSTWELAYIIYCKDHNIHIERNKEMFEYVYNEKKHYYIPDFIVNNEYIEIKGYETQQWIEKLKSFPHKLVVFDKNAMTDIFHYVKNKYGNRYIELYEGNPHKIKNAVCEICGQPAVNMYCSRKCSGIAANKRLYK